MLDIGGMAASTCGMSTSMSTSRSAWTPLAPRPTGPMLPAEVERQPRSLGPSRCPPSLGAELGHALYHADVTGPERLLEQAPRRSIGPHPALVRQVEERSSRDPPIPIEARVDEAARRDRRPPHPIPRTACRTRSRPRSRCDALPSGSRRRFRGARSRAAAAAMDACGHGRSRPRRGAAAGGVRRTMRPSSEPIERSPPSTVRLNEGLRSRRFPARNQPGTAARRIAPTNDRRGTQSPSTNTR